MRNKINAIILVVAAVLFAAAAVIQFNKHGIPSFLLLLSASILDFAGAVFYFVKKPGNSNKQ